MARQGLVWLVFAVWLLLAAASVVVPALTPPSDFGMTQGLNRMARFLQIQMPAVGAAILCFFLAKRLAPGWRRWLARLPLGLELLLGLAFVGMVVWSNAHRPPPGGIPMAPERPVTAPVAEPVPKPEG